MKKKAEVSFREREVLALIQKPSKVIGYELGITEATVKVHLNNIMRKYGVTRRTQLVALTAPAPNVTILLDALQAIADQCPLPSLVAKKALRDYGASS